MKIRYKKSGEFGGASQFTFQIGTAVAAAAMPTAPSVPLPGTLTVLFFTPGALVVGDTWTVAPDGRVTPRAGNTSAGGVAAKVDTGGHVYLTYDRGATWTDITAPAAPLPPPNPDLSALSPGPIGGLVWDSTIPNATRLFCGTLGGVYVLPAIPTPTAAAAAAPCSGA